MSLGIGLLVSASEQSEAPDKGRIANYYEAGMAEKEVREDADLEFSLTII